MKRLKLGDNILNSVPYVLQEPQQRLLFQLLLGLLQELLNGLQEPEQRV